MSRYRPLSTFSISGHDPLAQFVSGGVELKEGLEQPTVTPDLTRRAWRGQEDVRFASSAAQPVRHQSFLRTFRQARIKRSVLRQIRSEAALDRRLFNEF
jgi:hypothetical protein